MRKALIVTVAATLVLAACGGDNKAETGDTTEATSPAGSETTTSAATPAEFSCDLIAQAKMEALTGNPLEPGDASTNNISEDTATWTASECAWLNIDREDAIEVTLRVSRAADFPSGSIECPVPPGSPQRLSAPDTEMFWTFVDAGVGDGVGTLRVCTDSALLEVAASGPGGVAELLPVAGDVADAARAAL